MSRSASKNRNRREDKRYGHKVARQATRRALEGDGHATIARGLHWGSSVEQPPVMDVPVGPAPEKKRGCKKNNYGPHVVVERKQEPAGYYERTEDGSLVFVRTRRHYRWLPSYYCENCGKGFWRRPREDTKSSTVVFQTYMLKPGQYRSSSNWMNEVKDYHYDLYNIRCRLLGLPCRCKDCNPEESPDG